MAFTLIRAPLAGVDHALAEVPVRVERQKLAKRLWRGAADDGTDFGFELDQPLHHGDVVWATGAARYVIRQASEPVLEIRLDVAPAAAAMIGWAVGNLHFEVDAQASRLLAPAAPGLRQSLDRIGIHYRELTDIFQPHPFAAGHSGHSHHHSAGHAHA